MPIKQVCGKYERGFMGTEASVNMRTPLHFGSGVHGCGASAIGLKAMIEMCGVDRVLFGTDFGPVPRSPKVHIDLVNDTITDAVDRDKIFSTNTLAVLGLAESAPRLAPRAA
jgi:predicted TIM-barrel fold metal-dependent hydrolase